MNDLPIDHIRPDPDQPRKHFEASEIEELAATIAELGQAQPILVRPDPQAQVNGEPHYLLVAGERRWRANKLLGRATIEARVTDETDPAKLYALQIVENLQRSNLTTAETANGITALVTLPGPDGKPLGVNGAAKRLGKSPTWVSRHHKIARMAEPIRQLVANGAITDVDTADALNALHTEFPSLADNAIKQLRGENVRYDWQAPHTLTREGFRECLRRSRERAQQEAQENKRKADDPDYQLTASGNWEYKPKQTPKSKTEQDTERAKRKANEALRPLRERMGTTLQQIRQLLGIHQCYSGLGTGQLFSTDFVGLASGDKPIPAWDELTRDFSVSVDSTEQLARMVGALAHIGVTDASWRMDGYQELQLSGAQLDAIAEWLKAHPTGRIIAGDQSTPVAHAQPDVCMTLDEAIGTFIAECCELSPTGSTRIADAYDAWLDWCQATGNRACDQAEFSRQIQAGDVTKKRREDAHYFIGLALRSNPCAA